MSIFKFVCSICILTLAIIVVFRFGFKGRVWILIAAVPGLCILFTFSILFRGQDSVLIGQASGFSFPFTI